MNESLWTHLGIVAAVWAAGIPVWLAWRDSRKESQKRHEENIVRLSAIETQLKPIVDWFNNGRSKL